MRKRKKKLSKLKIIIGVLFIMVIILIIYLAFIITRKNTINNSKIQESEQTKELTQEEIDEIHEKVDKEKLAGMEERDRMEFYFSKFLREIETKNYEKAYEMLYEDFRNNYFPTLSDFEEYAKEKFPEISSVEHVNIERNGNIYVLWITISDLINGTKDSAVEMNVLVQEYDLNEFKISFSVL